ncbi:DUF4384 domain-containing protein [Azospirillum sp. TSO22-1]|uniref:DUF4384 domain-containing protein n=1 Tax=Azospirillum sp. TSO22-1 TaxID=716789 RepID=UPI000D606EAA|nr:DUF4384 domain-containing protein [Azospirillum sp. TSO22-1]PWC42409.1 hypothetical protein TSO221_21820 [Azospirillum sp. TSO22-1]
MPVHHRRPAVRSAHAPPLDAVLIRLLSATAIAAVALGCATAARAEAVVVASTAPAYKLGQVVSDGSAVQVPDGASAVFLFSSGRTVRVRGPYEGDLDKAPERDARAGSSVKANDRFVQSDLGAARTLGNPLDKAVERAFTIDPAVSGTYCVKAGSPPALRRPTQANPEPIVLQDVGRGVSANVTWAGAAVPWPRELALSDGTEIRVSGAGGAPRTLRFRQVDAAAGGSAALAVRMAAAGCTSQAGLVLSSLRDATVPLDLYLSAERTSVRTGEDVRLLLQTNRDAHVYCWLRNARAQLIPVFPAGSASAAVEGSAPRTLPLRAADSPGDAEVRCVASSRDLDAELPGRSEAFRPLDDATVAALDRTLSRLRDADLASSQVVVRIR